MALTGEIEDARMDGVSMEGGKQVHDLTLVSACLLGVVCRYDGKSCPALELRDLATRGKVIAICPEVVGGLPIPRLPAEIESASSGLDGHAVLDGRTRVLRSDGVDVTAQFIKGAQAALTLARKLGIRQAILKTPSPSCGAGRTHDGKFAGELVPGDGVTAALLKRNRIQVISETELTGGDT
jgi:uncharacterized protein YbbK (DUF523 family)